MYFDCEIRIRYGKLYQTAKVTFFTLFVIQFLFIEEQTDQTLLQVLCKY